jgi:putative endonuclease
MIVAPAKAGAAGGMELILMKQAYVYIMTNKLMGILYIGVTADLPARIVAHRSGTGSYFCRGWGLKRLVYAEPFDRIDEAIIREKALKKWKRVWKLRLISKANPEWVDLFEIIND